MTVVAKVSATVTATAEATRGEESRVGGRINRKKNNTRLVPRMACAVYRSFSFVSLLSSRIFCLLRLLNITLLRWLEGERANGTMD